MSNQAMEVDAAIVGSGQAAPALAVALAKRGDRVALIEGAQLGGCCVNVGCTPTKTLRKSARVAHLARRAAEFGVQVGEVEEIGRASCRGKSVDLGGRRIIKKKKERESEGKRSK